MVMGTIRIEAQLAVIGAGPGGYVAAIRAADLGQEVVLIEERQELGGVCLIEGCIPSKALISAVEVANAAQAAKQFGLTFVAASFELDKLRSWTKSVVSGLTKGVRFLLEKRGVQIIRGRARFTGANSLDIDGSDVGGVDFQHCIIATGSRINELPTGYGLPVWTSADALNLPEVPESLVVIGGGYIGLELGLVYAGLGARVTVVEFHPHLLMGADHDLTEVVVRHSRNRLHNILVNSRVSRIERSGAGFVLTVEHEGKEQRLETAQVLAAVGRKPNTDGIGLDRAGVALDQHGKIKVDITGTTSAPSIYAIGDITPGPMLAHKASREAKVAAEVLAGHPAAFDNRAIPAVVFTDPEIAWAGITEREALEQKRPITVGRFPLRALGRARTLGRSDGLVKVISDPETKLVLGVGMVGPHVSELIAEGALALEMGATLEDLMVTIHPHPTLSEAIMEAAEAAAGAPVHTLTS